MMFAQGLQLENALVRSFWRGLGGGVAVLNERMLGKPHLVQQMSVRLKRGIEHTFQNMLSHNRHLNEQSNG